jgi:hypothetical protein
LWVLIDPISEDPEKYICFNKEIPLPIRGNARGKATIEIFGLERLNDTRLEYLKVLKAILPLANIDHTDSVAVAKAAADLKVTSTGLLETINFAKLLKKSAAKKKSKFAACVRSNFPALPQ